MIATIPTVLAIEESARLARALKKEGVPTSTIIVNQVIGERMAGTYLCMKLKEQEAALELLASSPHLKGLQVIRGGLVELEVRGVPALQYFASTLWQGMPLPAAGQGEGLVRKGAHPPAPTLPRPAGRLRAIMSACAEDRKFYMLGGKGGVGKTTCAAALAAHMAAQGVPTLVVSTDPAHSLSDSLAQDISGGKPVPLSGTDLPIWGMEIDPEEARAELRELARGDGGAEMFETLNGVGLGKFAEQLKARRCPRSQYSRSLHARLQRADP